MKKGIYLVSIMFSLVFCLVFSNGLALAAEPITIGVVTSLSHPAGEQAYIAAQIAVDEINAAGGVQVGSEKRLIKVVTSDSRDAEPGVPVTDALLALEKTILEKKGRRGSGRAASFRSAFVGHGHHRQIQGPDAGHFGNDTGFRGQD